MLCSVSQKFSSPIALFLTVINMIEFIAYQWYAWPFQAVKSHFSFGFPSPHVAVKYESKTLCVPDGRDNLSQLKWEVILFYVSHV